MSRKRSKTQLIFWFLSIWVIAAMLIGLIVSFTPSRSRVTETPTPTASVTPYSTPTAAAGGG